MKTIKTFLPVFSGYYGTIFEDIIDSAEDLILEDDNLLFDSVVFEYKQFKTDIAEQCIGVFQDSFNRDMNTSIVVSFEALISPKYYNYENDSVNVSIEISEKDLETIIKTVKENREEIEVILEDKYSSTDGFISSHSVNLDEWLEDLEDEHKFGAILDILCEVLDIVDEEEMADRVRGNVSLDYTTK